MHWANSTKLWLPCAPLKICKKFGGGAWAWFQREFKWERRLCPSRPSIQPTGNESNNHTEYDVLGSRNKKDLPKVLGEILNPAVHEHLFWPALQSDRCKKVLTSEKAERFSTREDFGEGGLESKVRESRYLWCGFEIEDSAVHWIRVIVNYHQTTAANFVARTFVVEMAIHFWWSKAS